MMRVLSQTVHDCRLQVLGMMENPTSIMMMRVWSDDVTRAWGEELYQLLHLTYIWALRDLLLPSSYISLWLQSFR